MTRPTASGSGPIGASWAVACSSTSPAIVPRRAVPSTTRPGEPISPQLLDETLAAQGTALAPGDMLLVRTDYPRHLFEHGNLEGAHPHAGLEQSHEMLAWLWDHRVPLVAADTFAVECIPRVASSPLGAGDALGGGLLHPHLIALLGMVVGELWKLDDLADDCAADGVYELHAGGEAPQPRRRRGLARERDRDQVSQAK